MVGIKHGALAVRQPVLESSGINAAAKRLLHRVFGSCAEGLIIGVFKLLHIWQAGKLGRDDLHAFKRLPVLKNPLKRLFPILIKGSAHSLGLSVLDIPFKRKRAVTAEAALVTAGAVFENTLCRNPLAFYLVNAPVRFSFLEKTRETGPAACI